MLKSAAGAAVPPVAAKMFHVMGVQSKNWHDHINGQQSLLIVHCTPADADALERAFGDADPTVRTRWRSTWSKRLSYLSAPEQVAASDIVASYAKHAATMQPGDDADHVATMAGLSTELFGYYLTLRSLAQRSGFAFSDGAAPAVPPPAVSTQIAAGLRRLPGTLDEYIDDGDTEHVGVGEPGPLPSDSTVAEERVPDSVLATYPEAGEPISASGYYIRVTVENPRQDDDGNWVMDTREVWCASTMDAVLARRIVAIMGRTHPPTGTLAVPQFDAVRRDQLTADDEFLIDEALRADESDRSVAEIVATVQQRLKRLTAGATGSDESLEPAAAQSAASPPPPGPIDLVDDASDALQRLIDRSRDQSMRTIPARRDAHRVFQHTAATLLAFLDGAQGVLPASDPLEAVREAMGGDGAAGTDYSFRLRERAASELVTLRAALVKHAADEDYARIVQGTLWSTANGGSADRAADPPPPVDGVLALIEAMSAQDRTRIIDRFGTNRRDTDAGDVVASARANTGRLDGTVGVASQKQAIEREHAAKVQAAAEFLARNPTATKASVAAAADFHDKYFSRGRGMKVWDAIQSSATGIRRGWRRRDEDGEISGDVDAVSDPERGGDPA